jgi:hypothetical protein
VALDDPIRTFDPGWFEVTLIERESLLRAVHEIVLGSSLEQKVEFDPSSINLIID